MKIYELFPCEPVTEAVGRVLGRGAKGALQRKFRCTSGPRKGRVVADTATCTKRARTLRTSPASRIIRRTNIQRAGQAKKRRTISGLKKR